MIDQAWDRELMWAAGFFDGEGNVSVSAARGLRVQVTQRLRQPLERFQAASAVGAIREYELRGSPVYSFSCSGPEAEYLVKLLLPRVASVKAQQISEALATHDGRARYMSKEHIQKFRDAAKLRPKRVKTQEERERISRSQKLIERPVKLCA